MKSMVAGAALAMMIASSTKADEPRLSEPRSDARKLGSSAPEQNPSPQDLAAIRELATRATQAFNDGDASALARLYTDDAKAVTVIGDSGVGRDQIEQVFCQLLSTRMRDADVVFSGIEVRMVKPDVALADMDMDVNGMTGPDGQPLVLPPDMRTSWLLLKQDGKWLIQDSRAGTVLPKARAATS